MRRPTDRLMTQRVPAQRTRPPARRRVLELRISDEKCLLEVMRAMGHVGGSVFAVRVERVSTEPLLLVLPVDDEHLIAAIDAVLSVDSQAEAAALSRAPFVDAFEHNAASDGHTSEIFALEPSDGSLTNFWATCRACSWIGSSHERRERAEQDARLHRLERALAAH